MPIINFASPPPSAFADSEAWVTGGIHPPRATDTLPWEITKECYDVFLVNLEVKGSARHRTRSVLSGLYEGIALGVVTSSSAECTLSPQFQGNAWGQGSTSANGSSISLYNPPELNLAAGTVVQVTQRCMLGAEADTCTEFPNNTKLAGSDLRGPLAIVERQIRTVFHEGTQTWSVQHSISGEYLVNGTITPVQSTTQNWFVDATKLFNLPAQGDSSSLSTVISPNAIFGTGAYAAHIFTNTNQQIVPIVIANGVAYTQVSAAMPPAGGGGGGGGTEGPP